MNITVGFDVSWMSPSNISGGVFQYAVRLISALSKYTDLNIVVILREKAENYFNDLIKYNNFKRVSLQDYTSILELVETESINVIHTPLQFIINICTTQIPMIISLHDLQHFHHPDFFSETQIDFRNSYYKRSIESCERIIVSFNHVKYDIIKYLHISPDIIDICPVGIEPANHFDISEISFIKQKYDLSNDYLFYAANTWKHKNHINLIKALKILHTKYNKILSLVCTGLIYDDFYKEIEKEIIKQGVIDHVKFLGYLPEKDMLTIMKGANLVVIPTLYEAGSYPLLEAMAYHVPVICSNVTALPQQIGDIAYTFNPADVNEMAQKIYYMIEDDNFRINNIKNSKYQIQKLSWEKNIPLFIETYQKTIKSFYEKTKSSYFYNYTSNFEFFISDYYKRRIISQEIKNKKLQAELHRMKHSLSWRLTRPIRNSKILMDLLKLLK